MGDPGGRISSLQYISAADIEKFGYCPLSWVLSWEEEQRSDNRLKGGKEEHEKIAKSVSKAKKLEIKALTSEKLVLWYAIIATIIAVLGVDLLPFEAQSYISSILIVISLIWILAALFFLNMAFRTPVKDKILDYEKIVLLFAVVAVIIAINAVVFIEISEEWAILLEVISLIWLMAASFFLQRSLIFSNAARGLKEELQISGTIEYVDLDDSELLRSEKFGISGRPDYIVQTEDYRIPVEEKTGRVPRGPLFSHILQVAAYCLLLSETQGKDVPYGILKYGNDQHIVEYDSGLKNTLLHKIEDMRSIAKGNKPAHRNHNRASKCAGCSRRFACPERLA